MCFLVGEGLWCVGVLKCSQPKLPLPDGATDAECVAPQCAVHSALVTTDSTDAPIDDTSAWTDLFAGALDFK